MVARLRYLAAVAVGGLVVTTLVTFGIAVASTVALAVDVARGGWDDKLALVSVLQTVDAYLLAIVQLIVAIGLHELFVGDLDAPYWLEARSLDDLKQPIVDVLIVFVGVKGIERLLTADRPVDALVEAAAVAVLLVPLVAFRALAKGRRSGVAQKPPQPGHEGVDVGGRGGPAGHPADQ